MNFVASLYSSLEIVSHSTMGKKKPFIDRKKASTFHLVHRSQRDVAGDVLEEGAVHASDMVLWPSSANQSETNRAVLQTAGTSDTMSAWREKLSEAGLLDVDHERFLKPITGNGTFVDASGKRANPLLDPRAQPFEEDTLVEVNRQFDSIPLSSEFMDPEIADALFGDFDENDFEELDDEFVLQAAAEPEGGEEGFDFDDHIRQLMEKAKQEREDKSSIPDNHQWGDEDGAFFSKLKPLAEEDDEDFDFSLGDANLPGTAPRLSPEEERALCEKFEETLAEYDSGEIGEGPDEEVQGTRPLEGDTLLEAALNDFLEEREDEIFMHGTSHLTEKKGGSGFSFLVGKKMVSVEESGLDNLNKETPEPPEKILSEARDRLAEPVLKLPAEEIFIDGKSYFSESVRNPWDCESILSTYSNLDNNPVTIDASSRRRRKKKNHLVPPEEGPIRKIELSKKTGLPLGVLPSPVYDDHFDDTIVSVNKGIARNKKETAEQKKARKEATKRERQISRIQKKVTREIFQEEFQKRAGDVTSDPVGGKTVFRFS